MEIKYIGKVTLIKDGHETSPSYVWTPRSEAEDQIFEGESYDYLVERMVNYSGKKVISEDVKSKNVIIPNSNLYAFLEPLSSKEKAKLLKNLTSRLGEK